MNNEKIRNRLKSCRNCKPYENEGYKDCLICVEHNRFRFDPEIEKELEELESKATKWGDPQTQADLELAEAVRYADESVYFILQDKRSGKITSKTHIHELIHWYREQKRGE